VQAVGGGFSPHYNMHRNGIISPHNPSGYRTTSFRTSSKHRPSSTAPGGTPVSPLGVPITSQFAPTPVSGPTDLAHTPSRAAGGTPPADLSGLSNPFSWNAEGGHSAPLPPFPDAAHKAVHDEVMKARFSAAACACACACAHCAAIRDATPGHRSSRRARPAALISATVRVVCSARKRS
jgi:hypothetical protein